MVEKKRRRIVFAVSEFIFVMCEKVADDEFHIKIESVDASSQQQDVNGHIKFKLDPFTSEEEGHQRIVLAGTSTEQKNCLLDIGEYEVTSQYFNENNEQKGLVEQEARFTEPRIEFSFCSDTDSEGSDFTVEEHKIANQFLTGGDENLCKNEDSDSVVEEQEIKNQFAGENVKLSQNIEPTCKLADSSGTIVQDNVTFLTDEQYDIILSNAELVINDLFDDAAENEENDAVPESIGKTQVASELDAKGVHNCHICNTAFTGRACYLKHVRLFHVKSQRRKVKYTCKDQAFQQHVGTHADEKSSEFNVHDKRKIFNSTECSRLGALKTHVCKITGEKPFKCNVCDYTFSHSGALIKDIPTHSDEKAFKCTMCDYKCSQAGNLKIHVRTHTGEKPFKCTMCEFKCSVLGALTRHIRVHTGEKPFKCTVCDYKCSQSGDLKQHVRTHTGEKPFKCTMCDYKCSHSGNLKIHVRTHTGEKPYKCTMCEFKCSVLGALTRHIRIHTGEKPFKCTVCDYRCSQSGFLKQHVRKHTGEKPFKCTMCDYKCSHSGTLKNHVRKHTGEKPFKCTFCDFKCSHSGNLKTHVYTHTGEKPFKCTFCEYKCSQACHLKAHARKHTGDKSF